LNEVKMPPPYGAIVELLALTGQRRQEVSKLKWDELDEKSRTWSIPGSQAKNKKAHIVHLSEPAWQVIAQRPMGTYSTSKRALDTLSGITGCRPYDRRRTIVSGMARLGVPPHVADKILNHQAGTISGVAAVYQRHEFLVERKEPLDRWGAHVEHIVQALSLKTDDQTFVAPSESTTSRSAA
jgi:integrase